MRALLTGVAIGAGLGLVYAVVLAARIVYGTRPDIRYPQ
jgi:hypothetical protein